MGVCHGETCLMVEKWATFILETSAVEGILTWLIRQNNPP